MGDDLVLDRPTGVDATAWWAICQHRDRLATGLAASDRPLVLGSAKELVEAIAKVVVEARGEQLGANVEFQPLIGRAHAVLDRQPGQGLAKAQPLRELAQGAKTIAGALGPLRNAYGTGHGRTDVPAVTDEMLELAVAGAMLWSRWALRRAGEVLLGSLEPLLSEVRGAGTFRSGELTRRLIAANLPELDVPDQRRLGATVARRRMSGTYTVDNDGVEACAASDDVQRWPAGYRLGLVDGLLLDSSGAVHATPSSVSQAARALARVPDGLAAISELSRLLDGAPLGGGAGDTAAQQELDAAFVASALLLPQQWQQSWRELSPTRGLS